MIAAIVFLAWQLGPAQLNTQLIRAAREGDSAKVSALLAAGADVDARHEKTQWTPLTAACYYGHKETAEILIRAGADVNATDINGGTPMMKTVMLPGQDPTAKDTTNEAEIIARKAAILKALLAAGADAQKRDRLGGTSWQMAWVNHHEQFIAVFEAAGIQGIKEARLQEAIDLGNIESVHRLLGEGADVNYRDIDGSNALSEAVMSGNKEILAAVLDSGADVNAKFDHGRTALMIAVHNNNLVAVQDLLDAGADPDAVSADGNTALQIAESDGHQEAAKILRAAQKK